MSITRRVGLAVRFAAFLWVSVAATGSAQAQTQVQAQGASKGQSKAQRLAAREAYEKATVAFGKGDYVSALDGFTKANALIPNVVTLYWIALSQDKLGHTEAAIEGYETVSARDDFSKLSEDKVSTVRTRLAELKPPPAKPVEPLPSELTDAAAAPVSPTPPPLPPPPPPPEPAPLIVEPPVPAPPPTRVLPQRNTLEFGVLGGMLFVAKSNNLAAEGKKPTKYDPTWQLGVRAAFFPEKVFGFEAEYAHGFGHWGCGSHCDSIDPGRSTKGSASFNSVRGHLIGQIPTSRVVPFALAGAGFLRVRSNQTGADQDLLIHVGVGAKVLATKQIVPRIDFRLDMTQKKGGGLASGIAFHPELLLGLSFALGRLLP